MEPIPDAMPVTEAALAEPVAVAWHAVRLGAERLHLPLAAARIVVLGGGAIGVAAAVVARRFGAVDLRVGEVNTLRHRALETLRALRPIRRVRATSPPTTVSIW